MSYLIVLDDGHGSATPGKRTPVISGLGRVIKENEFNKAVVYYLDQELKRCGFRTLLVAPGDSDVGLTTRTHRANAAGAHAYISCHYNAGGGSGVETFHYPGSRKSQKLAKAIHKYVIQGTSQKNRGVKSANFAVLRQTNMPAALIEFGFMDDPGLVEARRMLDVRFQKECAQETAQGICEYFGVPYKGDSEPNVPTQPAPYDNNPEYHRLLALESPMMRGADIKRLQQRLQSKVIDGIFGSATESDVKSWQSVHDGNGNVVKPGRGLEVDGIVGPSTWRALFTGS